MCSVAQGLAGESVALAPSRMRERDHLFDIYEVVKNTSLQGVICSPAPTFVKPTWNVEYQAESCFLVGDCV